VRYGMGSQPGHRASWSVLCRVRRRRRGQGRAGSETGIMGSGRIQDCQRQRRHFITGLALYGVRCGREQGRAEAGAGAGTRTGAHTPSWSSLLGHISCHSHDRFLRSANTIIIIEGRGESRARCTFLSSSHRRCDHIEVGCCSQ
jgi:hypothetical protein